MRFTDWTNSTAVNDVGAADAPIKRWYGERPSTPDGLPVIGRSWATADIVYAFGHGHVGLAAAPATASLVAKLVAGGTADREVQAFAASRLTRASRT